ncbi:sulfatase-like hydrolase/transferase [Phenylobacterium sp.]|jgi:arylsulfatase A-like enzyme|uniref:sulfatase-like hydrolase/transferase n=1 Tax=Phenylobacterium sp. TaxID=1871053 RepID=UPI002E360F4F|nr:sulfatase-like hydrolase/transferase [Phenylobacterium sp.]HEX4711586.1 sulfatase-like hydrolase/transferase [Phenylobacterium sp.]
MQRRTLLQGAGAALATLGARARAATAGRRPPNFVIVLCDDLGYGDVSVYEPGGIKTPAIERMGREGVVLTDYYAPANLCSPSRAGLLTGRYPVRTGLGYEVIMQQDDRGLPLSEVTIAKALKPAYATALFGKWHLGHLGPSWPPTTHGFDAFFGIPYSHDMKPLSLYEAHAGSDETVKSEVDYPQLQQQFYAHAERFIEANKDRPFFVELALSAPHLPEHPHAPFDSSTFAGPYGAVVQEIDSIVGRLLAKLRDLKIERDTVVIFTSDNGPWFEGSPGWLRERKGGGGFDGGYRVPFIAWAPGRFPAGKRVSSMISGIDLLPTFRAMAGLPPLEGVTMDGRDITKVLAEGAASPHAELVLFDNETPIAIRTQDWKYIDGIYYRANRFPMSLMGYQELFDLKADPSENYSVAETYPDVARDMKARLDAAKTTFAPFKHKDIPPVFKALQAQMRGLPD